MKQQQQDTAKTYEAVLVPLVRQMIIVIKQGLD